MSAGHVLAFASLFAVIAPTDSQAGLRPDGATTRQLRRVLLAVGVDVFAHPRPPGAVDPGSGWAPLQFAAKDAADVQAAFARYGFEGRALTGTRATNAGVWSALDDIAATAAEDRGSSFEIVVYLSSHGFAMDGASGNETFIATYDTPPEWALGESDGAARARSSAVATSEILQRFVERLGANVLRTAIIYDACFVAGGKAPQAHTKGTQPPIITGQLEVGAVDALHHATLVLAAVSPGQRAIEIDALENSIYTHHLVRALVERDERPKLLPGLPFSLFEAHQLARRAVSGARGRHQTPSWAAPRINEGPGLFFLEPVDAGAVPAVIVLEPRPAGVSVSLSEVGRSKGWGGVVPAEGMVLPRAGEYVLSIARDDEVLYRDEVVASSGEVVSIDAHAALAKRARHHFDARGGVQLATDLWGANSGMHELALVEVGYALSRWPVDGLRAGLSATAGYTSFSDPTATGATVADLVVGLSVRAQGDWVWGPVGLGVGPGLGAGFLRRTTNLPGDDPVTSALWTAGLYADASLAIAADVDVTLAVEVSAAGLGDISQGVLLSALTIGLRYRAFATFSGAHE